MQSCILSTICIMEATFASTLQSSVAVMSQYWHLQQGFDISVADITRKTPS